jgi:predicted nucleotidyltransferase
MASDSPIDSVLSRIVQALQDAGVPYMLTGSFASSLHGSPRVTQDVDIVIAPTLGSLQKLLGQFPEDAYYVSKDAALQAYGSEGMFNVVDFDTGWKVDFIVRKSRAFSLEEFERRHPAMIESTNVVVASAEDVIIAKLEWAKLGESERQLRDVASILSIRGSDLDVPYIDTWVEQLDIADQWSKAKSLLPS